MAFEEEKEENDCYKELDKGDDSEQSGLRAHVVVDRVFVRVVNDGAKQDHQEADECGNVHT